MPGFGDSDGDGVPDGSDPAPTDPHACGDSNADGCDDCSTGHFDLVNDCQAATSPAAAGCCETGSGGPAAPLALGFVVVATLRRRRRS
jgi:MYXO-CTERM domain-containing protein